MVSAVDNKKYTAFNLRFATSLVYQTLAPFFSTLIKLLQESDKRPDGLRLHLVHSLISAALARRFLGFWHLGANWHPVWSGNIPAVS